MRKELLRRLFKQSKCISLIIALNICVVIVHYSGEDLVQLDLDMTIKSEYSELVEENKCGDIR